MIYKEYQSISKKPDSSTFVPPELFEAQQQAILKIPMKLRKDWDNWVSNNLGISQEKLWEGYSSEQIDSIGIAIYNFENTKNFFIGDETGIGKGRILSGISRWAWNQGKKVLFFTEREHLISEFWKDLYHTNNIEVIKSPISFHSKSKVFNLDSEVELKGTKKIITEIENNGFNPETNLVMTNYSQISLKQHKAKKLQHLLDYAKDAILIMDECHNATGDSNTKDILIAIKDVAINTVFSSATYLKDESQLDLYESSFNLDPSTIKILRRTLKNDRTDTLRKVFTYELTKSLQFWRREHEPLVDAYHTLFCDNEEYSNQVIQRYSETINGLFKIVNTINQDPSLESNVTTNAWFALGATINRLSRNLLLVLKLDTVIASVKEQIKNNRKAVIVLDSTLASLVQKISTKESEDLDENQEEITDFKEGSIFNFQRAIRFIIDEVLGEALKSPYLHPDIKKSYDELIEKTDLFANLSLSPIDTLLQAFEEANIRCGEISGRTFRLNNEGKIEKLPKKAKTQIVAQFNNGESNVVIITRAGASGISLHASAAFKDQKVRVLYELEITNRPTYRLQFMGRVNRKNQVEKPLFFLVVTKLPFEQRILNVEQRKLQKLQSHISGDTDKMEQTSIINFYNDHTEEAALLFLQNNKSLAYQMGISLKKKEGDFFYVDSLLKRCIVLPIETQNFLYDYLLYTVDSFEKLSLRKNIPLKVEMKEIKNFWHQMDDTEIARFRQRFENFPYHSINQFQFPWVGVMKIASTYKTNAVYSHQLQKEFNNNLNSQTSVTNYCSKIGQFFSQTNNYSRDYLNQNILPRLRQIQLGNNIIISNPEGKIYGYIHNVITPEIVDKFKYPHLTLIHVKAVNPNLHNSLYYCNEDYYLTLVELIESSNIEFSSSPIDWQKFNRPIKEFQRENFCFIGHPVYIQFLHQCYDIGDIEYFNIGSSSSMCLLLPPTFSEKFIQNMKKPIFEPQRIINGIMAKKIGALTTVWQGDNVLKPYFRIEKTDGGYLFKVAEEIYKDADIFDFALKKKLTEYRGKGNGFYIYFIPYKELPKLLYTMDKRNVIWFIEPYIAPLPVKRF